MHHEHAMRAPSPQPTVHGSTPVLLQGRLLHIARGTWLLIATLSVGLFLTGLPYRYSQLLNACVGNGCKYGQLSPEGILALQDMGFSPALYVTYDITLASIVMLAYIGVAFVIFWRRPQEWGALLAALWMVTFGTDILGTQALAESQPFLQSLVELLSQLGWTLLLPLFLLTFPDGRFTPNWTRWLFLAYAIQGSLVAMSELLWPNLVAGATWGMVVWFGMQFMGVGAQIYRFLRVSDPVQQQRTKWVIFGLATTVLILVLYGEFSPAGPLSSVVETAVVSTAFLILPLTLGISILRYRLWDIDLLISRALIWGLLSGIVIGLYVLTVSAVGALFQSRGTFLPSLLATGLIAVLFHPLRQRIQRRVNRLMYGERDEPYAVLSRLGKRLEATLAPEAVLPTIVETVAQTLKLPYVAITLNEARDYQVAASVGEPVEKPMDLPLTYQGEVIGHLICGPRVSGESFKKEEQRLLVDIARQAGVALQAVQSNADLQRSRERLVITREEERRRIRRDLHDGLGPALASQTLKIGSARALLKRDPEAADELLQQLETDSKAALQDVRRLVYNLRPPALDELGLLRAIQQDAPRHPGLVITFELPPGPLKLSAAVEVAVYRIVQEALANVVRHARASRASVRIETGAALRLAVADNGQGLPAAYRSGVGLNSMRERAEELGGSFKILSARGAGTTIEVRLPLRGKEA
ncbi:MAG TPA: GAF domain-containing sensor histidine kinase [Anaerolineae bacterium]